MDDLYIEVSSFASKNEFEKFLDKIKKECRNLKVLYFKDISIHNEKLQELGQHFIDIVKYNSLFYISLFFIEDNKKA